MVRNVLIAGVLVSIATAVFFLGGGRRALEAIAGPGSLLGQLEHEREARVRLAAEGVLLEKENSVLRSALAVATTSPRSLLLARVLTTRPVFVRHTLVVDLGGAEGVEPGMVAFLAPQAQGEPLRYVGHVSEARETTALVETPFHRDSRIIAATPSGVRGVVQSQFATGIVFRSTLTAEGLAPTPGDNILVAPGVLGAGMLIGEVESAESEGGYVQARLKSPVEGIPGFVFLLRP